MRKRLAAVGLSVILGGSADAQQPPFPVAPPASPPFPVQPPVYTPPRFPAPGLPAAPMPPGSLTPSQPPQLLPPGLLPPLAPPAGGAVRPGPTNPAAPLLPPGAEVPRSPIAEIPLPQQEQKAPLSAMDVQVKRVIGGWQVCAGQKVIRDLGENETTARDLVRVFRDLRPTEWVTIGNTAKPVVEYGLTNGRPAATAAAPDDKTAPKGTIDVNQASAGGPIVTGAGAKVILPIDLRTARVEPIRGVWCVRDDDTLLFNFGPDKRGAEQAVAVIQKYGFNRVGLVGSQTQPVMSYLFVSQEQDRPKVGGGQILFNAQVDALTRTGIPIPGVGYTGEMVKIDPKKVEARRDGAEWVVASGSEVLGRFGPTEWAAREAARTVQDAKFTEFCRLGGTSGMTFFLRDGKPPARAPLNTLGRNFDLGSLKVQEINGKWAVIEGNRTLFDVSSQQEGEIVVRVLKAYGFDQMAHLTAGGSKNGITFMVKNR
jgi:hypothetical protein